MNPENIKKTPGNQSTIKTMKIIEKLAKGGTSKRLTDLSNSVELNPSTTLRFLNTLEECGYVHQDKDSQKYSLTLKLVSISQQIPFNSEIKNVVHKQLVELVSKFEESACLAIENDGEALYLDVVEGPFRVLRGAQRIGHRAPLHSTGVGKLLLLNYDTDELDALAKNGFNKLTYNTISSLAELETELNKVKKNLYAIDDEECEVGLRCIAVPIIDNSGKIIAAISISGPTGRLTEDKVVEMKDALNEATKKIVTQLGI